MHCKIGKHYTHSILKNGMSIVLPNVTISKMKAFPRTTVSPVSLAERSALPSIFKETSFYKPQIFSSEKSVISVHVIFQGQVFI